jgi:hypothetical protein
MECSEECNGALEHQKTGEKPMKTKEKARNNYHGIWRENYKAKKANLGNADPDLVVPST